MKEETVSPIHNKEPPPPLVYSPEIPPITWEESKIKYLDNCLRCWEKDGEKLAYGCVWGLVSGFLIGHFI